MTANKQPLNRAHDDAVVEMLRADPDFANEDLAAALEEANEPGGQAALMVAPRHVAESQGMVAVAERAGMPRENLYRALSPRATPPSKPCSLCWVQQVCIWPWSDTTTRAPDRKPKGQTIKAPRDASYDDYLVTSLTDPAEAGICSPPLRGFTKQQSDHRPPGLRRRCDEGGCVRAPSWEAAIDRTSSAPRR